MQVITTIGALRERGVWEKAREMFRRRDPEAFAADKREAADGETELAIDWQDAEALGLLTADESALLHHLHGGEAAEPPHGHTRTRPPTDV